MGTIDIGIGHDDHFVITDLTQVKRLRVLFGTERDTQRGEDITNLFGLEYLMLHRFLHVQDLTAQRQDSLVYAVTTGLSRTACRVSLHEEELALRCIFRYAVGQLTGQTTSTQRTLTQHALTRVTSRDTGLRRQDHFLYDALRILRVLLQIVLQRFGYGCTYHTGHFRVTQLGLRLTLELRFGYLDGDNRRQTLTKIVRIDSRVTVLIFELRLLEHLALLRVFLHYTRESRTETGYVGTTLNGIDVIDVGVYVLVEVGVVDHSYLNRRTVFLGIQMNHLADERRTGTVDITNELTQTLLRVELLFLAVTLCVFHAFVLQHDLDTGIQERQLTHTVREDIPVINGLGEDRIIRPELHERTGLTLLPVTCSLRLCDRMHRSQRFSLLVILAVDSTLTVHLHVHLLRERIHTTHTYTVETTGYLVTILVELTTGVEHGHNNFQRTLMLLRMHIYRNTTTVILNGNGVILVDMNGYLITETGECLINGVIHHFINQVVQTLKRYIADIHRRTFTHRL